MVISVSFNTRRLTALVLCSPHRVLDADISIVVVDNGSTDGSIDLLTQAHDAGLCTLIASKTNHGHGEALNLALHSRPARCESCLDPRLGLRYREVRRAARGA